MTALPPAQEIDALVQDYGIRNIKFVDEMFVLNKAHVLGICERIIELRERFGVSYLTVFDGRETGFDQVVSRLAGA